MFLLISLPLFLTILRSSVSLFQRHWRYFQDSFKEQASAALVSVSFLCGTVHHTFSKDCTFYSAETSLCCITRIKTNQTNKHFCFRCFALFSFHLTGKIKWAESIIPFFWELWIASIGKEIQTWYFFNAMWIKNVHSLCWSCLCFLLHCFSSLILVFVGIFFLPICMEQWISTIQHPIKFPFSIFVFYIYFDWERGVGNSLRLRTSFILVNMFGKKKKSFLFQK